MVGTFLGFGRMPETFGARSGKKNGVDFPTTPQ
jgi:hypothetical protein